MRKQANPRRFEALRLRDGNQLQRLARGYTDLRRLDGVGLGEAEGGFGGRGGSVPHPGAVTERVAGEGQEALARRRECGPGRRAGHAEEAQQARRAAK